MKRQTIFSKGAPQAIGPYSQAIRTGDTVYLSGQIPLDPLGEQRLPLTSWVASS